LKIILKNKINEISQLRLLFSSKMTNFVEELKKQNIMLRIHILLVFFLSVGAVLAQDPNIDAPIEPFVASDMSSFGVQIDENNVMSTAEMSDKYTNMAIADTVQTKFMATVTEVCQAKGCWMKLQLENGQETMVRFKDYGFFMPKDITGKAVIVNGLAFVEEMSVENQKHYAKDGGQSEAELAQITTIKKSLGFEADGVLLKE
jgi:hypothetical protein